MEKKKIWWPGEFEHDLALLILEIKQISFLPLQSIAVIIKLYIFPKEKMLLFGGSIQRSS